ncbi:hypothetical protein CDAR_454161 [Caerostris darwini]|uniref:Uncharacterized protein n=1 Tax=Caerostris darwini TaxID=1538125 RepID=A0AAV4V922_9ARAC|nr:hypothetical protein CDAR_454161 [Caerostris darwini]
MKWVAKNMHFGNRPYSAVPAIYPVSETVAAYRESGSCCYSIFRNTTSGSNFFSEHIIKASPLVGWIYPHLAFHDFSNSSFFELTFYDSPRKFLDIKNSVGFLRLRC